MTQALLVPVHSLLSRQPAAQVLLLVQYCPAGQLLSWVQATQLLVVVLQNGVAPLQLAFCVHATQVLVCVLQTGVVPLQLLFWVHCTQTALVLPLVPEQTEVGLEQGAEPPQRQLPLTQRLLVPVHSESARQPTAQVLLAVQYCPVGQ